MDCYSTTIGKNFLLWLLAVTSNKAKIIPLKMGLPGLRIFYVATCKQLSGLLFIGPSSLQGFFFSSFTHHNGKSFLCCKCNQLYGLLPHHYWQWFLALVICLITSNETKMLSLKMGLQGLGVAFICQARYYFW